MSRSSEFQRYADRYIGIVLIALLRPFSFRKRPLPDQARDIGVIQPSALGDTILSSGLLASLHSRYPSARLHLFHGLSNAAAVPLLDTELVPHLCDFSKPLATIKQIRSKKLDILIDLVPWPRLTALISFFSRARCVVGYRTPDQHRHWLYDIVVDHLDDRHELDNLSGLREVLGVNDCRSMALRLPSVIPQLAVPVDRLVLMHTQPGGSRAYAKRWPEKFWVQIAQQLCDCGWFVGFTGSGRDAVVIDSIMKQIDRPARCVSLCDTLTFAQLATLLPEVRLLITVDTGVLHLAAAVDARILALHGPTSSKRWGARNSKSISLDADHPSRGYISLGFERHPDEMYIMSALTPTQVFAAAQQVLSSTPLAR